MPQITATRNNVTVRATVTAAALARLEDEGWTVVQTPTFEEDLRRQVAEHGARHNALVDELVQRGAVPAERAAELKHEPGQGPNSNQE